MWRCGDADLHPAEVNGSAKLTRQPALSRDSMQCQIGMKPAIASEYRAFNVQGRGSNNRMLTH